MKSVVRTMQRTKKAEPELRIHAVNGDIEGAIKFWQQALEAGSDNDKAIRRKIKLKKYVEE